MTKLTVGMSLYSVHTEKRDDGNSVRHYGDVVKIGRKYALLTNGQQVELVPEYDEGRYNVKSRYDGWVHTLKSALEKVAMLHYGHAKYKLYYAHSYSFQEQKEQVALFNDICAMIDEGLTNDLKIYTERENERKRGSSAVVNS